MVGLYKSFNCIILILQKAGKAKSNLVIRVKSEGLLV